MLILIGIPLFLCAFALVCARSDKKTLFCTAFAAAVLAVCGVATINLLIDPDAMKYPFLWSVIGTIPFSELGMIEASPAYMLIMKICSAFTEDISAFLIITACIQAAVTVYAVAGRCSEPYQGAAVLAFCFFPAFFAGSGAFTAAAICITASRYIEERRFFRFAAVILAAACFDMSALLMLPIYFVMLIPGAVAPSVASAFIALLAVIFPDTVNAVIGFLGEGVCTAADVPPACAVTAVAAATVSVLMYAMFKNRPGHHEALVPVMSCGAAFTAASVFEPKLYAISLMLLMQSSVVLAPEAYEIGKRFVGILFPAGRKTAERVFLAVCIIVCAGICTYLVVGNVFGSDAYEFRFGTEGSL